jgi:hypothetical protein
MFSKGLSATVDASSFPGWLPGSEGENYKWE